MDSIRVVRDLEEAKSLRQVLMPGEVVTDLWEVRECFHRHFRRPVHFIVQEDGNTVKGLLPLCWIEETDSYAFFPGETWHDRTWLEQNLIIGEDPFRLLEAVPGPYHIRYLSPRRTSGICEQRCVDEVGYLFVPGLYGYDHEKYMGSFSGKSRKRIIKEIQGIESRGIEWRIDQPGDIDLMIAMNIQRFGPDSYFSDPRFQEGFTEMLQLFAGRGWLRVTTALVEGKAAAVDVGVLYQGTYTLMAGSTGRDYPGIAKVINMHHIKKACTERMREVDFLCGDFNWKKMFHLQERPLFLAADAAVRAA